MNDLHKKLAAMAPVSSVEYEKTKTKFRRREEEKRGGQCWWATTYTMWEEKEWEEWGGDDNGSRGKRREIEIIYRVDYKEMKSRERKVSNENVNDGEI